ncbi:MAG: T9SS type A sorting domain-containing protein [Candidatus Stygibacter australis]|nr:T9SS type A sorting domain-containing protein [Candidatus Stygibacter australis]
MRKTIMLIVILVFTIELLSFSEPVEIDNDLNGELLINYEKNVQIIDGKLWILYYDVAIHPMTTYLKLAREQEDGSFEVMTLCSMNIATGVRSELDCTFAVQDEEVTIFYQKTYSNIEDVRVFKMHSNNLMNNYQESEFSSQYSNIAEMSLKLSEDELVLILLRGDLSTSTGINSLYYEYASGNEFNGQDIFSGQVYSKDYIYIHQTGQGNNNGWPTFNDLVVTEQRIMDVSTGAPAQFSAPMDVIFRGGYIEESSSDYELPEEVVLSWNGYILDSSIDRDLIYVKIQGTTATCRYADIETHLDTITVYNSFPDAEHNDLAIGDSIWTNEVEVKEYDWDDGTFTFPLQNQSMVSYCPMWIEGDVSGPMTIGCTDSIYVTSDLTYSSVTPGNEPQTGFDYLGLVSEKSIVVKYKNYDPDIEMIKSDNCDGVYIYGVLAALGEVDDNYVIEPTAGNLQVEYLHPHGSTPAYEIERNGYRELFPYPDLNKFVYSNAVYYSGDQGFVMHSNDMPAGYPCCGYPYENEAYGNGIITPYGADYPWYNPVYPESSTDIVFDRGTIELYGALIERGFHKVYCSGDDPDAHHSSNCWNPFDGWYGGEHEPCGYELNLHYDDRLEYQNELPPELHTLVHDPEYRVTILHSANGGDSFVQRYDQLIDNNDLNINKNLQAVEEDGIIAFVYNCLNEYRIDHWDTNSFGMTTESFSLEEFTGNIKSLRLLDNTLYFQDDEEIFELENSYLYPLSDLLEADFNGFNFETADRILWSADWQGYDLDFMFYATDEYWDFDDIGESTYEYGYDVDYFNLEDIYLKVYGQREVQLFLHGRDYNEDTFYLARDQIAASIASSDEISEIVNMNVYPNPFNPELTVKYNLEEAQRVEITVYNLKGEKVKTLLEEQAVAGAGEKVWDGRNAQGSACGSGVYFVQMKTGNERILKKALLLK